MEFVTEILGLAVTRTVWPQQNQLPLFLLEKYRFEQVNVGGTLCLFLQPLQDVLLELKRIYGLYAIDAE